MDSNSAQLCRLCLETSDDSVNIFGKFQDSTVASILAKHFWFQVDKNDVFSEWLCQICWIQTKTFHHFYKRIEFRHGKNYRSNAMVSVDSIKQEICVSPRKQALEPDLDLVKCEETEPPVQLDVFLISKEENSFDYNDLNDDRSEKSETDDEDQPSNKIPKNDDVGYINDIRNQTLPEPETKCCISYSRTEQAELDAKICEFFNMNCEICNNIKFETLLETRRHYRKVHKLKGYLTCCGKKFWRRHKILDHIRYHTDPHAYRCDQCDRSFHNKKALENHTENHAPLDSRSHKCSLCSSSFTKGYLLKYHVQSRHPSDTGEKFSCEKCEKSFRSKETLTNHVRSVHVSLEHVCDICGRRFKKKFDLLKHIQFEHSTTPLQKVQCNICGSWLKHKRGLQLHIIRQHQDVQKVEVVNCPICNKEKKNKRLLSAHIKYVHGERSHQCTLCDKKFKVAQNLKEHVAIHTGEDLYNCPFCEKKFKSNANMYAHRKKAHMAELLRDSTKKSTEAIGSSDRVESG